MYYNGITFKAGVATYIKPGKQNSDIYGPQKFPGACDWWYLIVFMHVLSRIVYDQGEQCPFASSR